MASMPSRVLALSLIAAAGAASASDTPADASAWWERLQSLCGNAYEGTLIRAPEGDDTFRDARVVMHVRDCSADRVRIPLVVDADRSRTWVLTRTPAGIELKHDHRHADGTPDTMTMYGGTTSNAGSADTQMFPADAQTREVIPGSGLRSAWLIELHPGERFIYAANRVGTDRGFQVDFDLTRPVQAPEAPWGWTD